MWGTGNDVHALFSEDVNYVTFLYELELFAIQYKAEYG